MGIHGKIVIMSNALKDRRLVIATAVILIITGLLYAARERVSAYAWEAYVSSGPALVLGADTDTLSDIAHHYYGYGERATKEYDPETALRAYELLAQHDPVEPFVYYQIARIYFVLGDFGKALEAIEKEMELFPENARAYYTRGLIYGYQYTPETYVLAESDFRYFTQQHSAEWAGYADLAWVMLAQGKYEETASVVRDAIEQNPHFADSPWLLNSLGVAYLNSGKYEEALEVFDSALREAKGLTEADWYRAYPGNAPVGAAERIRQFVESIQRNMDKAHVLNST